MPKSWHKSCIALAIFVCFCGTSTRAQFSAAPGTGTGLPETLEAIDSARVTTRILYITAHPDDESGAVLTYLARGLHADVALLSVTRGEGGQNVLGPEQAPQLGLIRTQELLAATRGYGVKLFFTRARDFGYSKTPEETEKIWGDQVIQDLVSVIRQFRPNVVINHWGNVHSGHGHHQATGLLTPKAVDLAAQESFIADPNCKNCDSNRPWKVSQLLTLDRFGKSAGYALPLDEISPLYGKSWREIGLDGFINHRTQGISNFIGSPFLRQPISLVASASKPLQPSELASPLSDAPCDALKQADALLAHAREIVTRADYGSAVVPLADAANLVERSGQACGLENADRQLELLRVEQALQLTAGAGLRAEADRSELVAGEKFVVTTRVACRKAAACEFGELKLATLDEIAERARTSAGNDGYSLTLEVLAKPRPQYAPDKSTFLSGSDSSLWAQEQPEPAPLVVVEQKFKIGSHSFAVRAPVTTIQASSLRVDRVPLRVVPAYTLSVEPAEAVVVLTKEQKPFDILLRVHSYATTAREVSVALSVPPQWETTEPATLKFSGAGDQYAKFLVTPPLRLTAGKYFVKAYVKSGDEKFDLTLESLPSLPTQFWSAPAECRVDALDIKVPSNLRVGYVSAESEPVPAALESLGIAVEMLDPVALAFRDLSRFDAVVVGVRAYELRSDLAGANQRLLDYAFRGGTLLVQYQRDFAWDKRQYAPFPAKIEPKSGSPLPRTTDESSPVKFLKPDDPLLNTPNKITSSDFQDWVQERGLYYWSDFDPKYTPLLAMNDPGEPELNGSLVYTKYGKGIYIYTGLAFFRQLPEGVPGAYRLFVNLLNGGKPQ